MQASTGRVFTLAEAAELKIPAHDLVLVDGPPEAVQRLSRNAKLGAEEAARRAKRRKQQRQSRKRNR